MPTVTWTKYEYQKTVLTKNQFDSLKQFIEANPKELPFPKDTFTTKLKKIYENHKYEIFVIPIGLILSVILMFLLDLMENNFKGLWFYTFVEWITVFSVLFAIGCLYQIFGLFVSIKSFFGYYSKRKRFFKELSKTIKKCPNYATYLLHDWESMEHFLFKSSDEDFLATLNTLSGLLSKEDFNLLISKVPYRINKLKSI